MDVEDVRGTLHSHKHRLAAGWIAGLGRTTHLRSLVDAIPLATPWTDALPASLADDNMHAAELYTEIGSRMDAAFAHLRAAEALTAQGRPDDARPHLEYAVEFYGSVGATLYLERAASMPAQADHERSLSRLPRIGVALAAVAAVAGVSPPFRVL